METQLELLESEVLKLSPSARTALAQRLLASLEEDDETDETWTEEIERRVAEIEAGSAKLIPVAEALAQVRSKLK